MTIKAITTNYIYSKLPVKKQSENIYLINKLTMTTEWVKVIVVGPDSTLQSGDEALISARPASYIFEHEGTTMHNLDDKATIAYKHNGVLHCTNGTFLYSWLDDAPEEITPSGIVLTTKAKNAVEWALVHAVGPNCGFNVGDIVLLKYETTAYPLEIDGIKMKNGGKEEVIAYKSPVC